MSFNHHITSKTRIQPEDWQDLCKAMAARAEGFTFRDIADDIHVDHKTSARRIYTLEEMHGPLRQLVTTLGGKGFRTFKLTNHGRKVVNAIAFGTPMPGRNGYRKPKLSAVEEAWLALRETIKMPQPFQDYSSTVSRAIA